MTDPVAHAPAAVPELAQRQRVYLLDQVARGPDEGLAQGDANNKIPTAIKRELMLDSSVCNRLRSELEAMDLLRSETVERKQLFQLTNNGRAYLEEHRAALPTVTPGPRGKVNPPKNDEVRQQRTTYLLLQLFQADQHTLPQAKANRFDAVGKKLDLNAATAWMLRRELAQQGLLTISPAGRSESYTLTDNGRAYVEEHRDTLPTLTSRPKGKVIPPKNDEFRQYRATYLLFQLFRADRHTLSQAQANRFDTLAKKLALNAATAWELRRELAQQGLLTINPAGRSESYTLTPEGRLKLGTLTFAPEFDAKLRGTLLNDLLEAARDAARDFRGTEHEPEVSAKATVPDTVSLQQAIMAAFTELAREQHGASGLVPIHEVRAIVRQKLGEQAAHSEVFDRVLLGLRQTGQLRLIPITDGTQVSAEALSASIPGVGETLFFMEAAREPVAHGSPV